MSEDNVVQIKQQPMLCDQVQEKAPERERTRGERLVGYDFNPSGDFAVKLTKHRHARNIDALVNHPIARHNGLLDVDHEEILREAVRRQIDAQMWAVKALTWGK